MKKMFMSIAILAFCLATAAVAVPPGKTLDYDNSALGTVTFSGQVHKDAGVKCMECHNKDVFPKMKFGTVEIKMADIYAGKYCGVCHNGQRAFEAKANCNRCHVKQ